MTPEQEALADALRRCAKLVAGIERDMADFAPLFPLDEDFDADEPTGAVRHLLRSFAKSFEQLQDQIASRLCRSVLTVVHGKAAVGHRRQPQVLAAAAALVGLDAAVLRDLTDVRNSLAHEYAMDFADVAPILNRAWRSIADSTATVAAIEAYVRDARLLDNS